MLLGGETAEMPGFYADGEYDVAGFIVGMVDREQIIDGSQIAPGQILIGLPSAGLHTNGFSLARKIFFEVAGLSVEDTVEELGETVGETLLAEHVSYLDPLTRPITDNWVRGLVHVTGGGMTDNIPRVLPAGTSTVIYPGNWPALPVFEYLRRKGGVAEAEMYRTFNMGIGMIVVVDPDEAVLLECHLDRLGRPHHRIGEIIEGGEGVSYA